MLDRWQKREVERALAHELNVAQEKFRLCNLKFRDLTNPMLSGIPAADSDLAIRQAHQTSVEAFNEWLFALDRWTKFVKYGALPGKANPGRGERRESAE